MSDRPYIDPALGLDLVPERTLASRPGSVAIVIPAHNERDTVAEVVADGLRALHLLRTEGEVIVAASGCTDDTAAVAAAAGARVVDTALGKGNAITTAVHATSADIVCLIDGDFRYYGESPLAVALVAPILRGIADATIADLYWRPLYPQIWLYGFFAPLTGRLFPELLAKVGMTPWSGQRAAPRRMWPVSLPAGFTSDLAILLSWNDAGIRLRPVLADDWVNPQRPKPELLAQEFALLADHAVACGRLDISQRGALDGWFTAVHHLMAEYSPGHDDPQQFEVGLLTRSLTELDRALTGVRLPG
jgi:glycosyltransferase involved in cell wall biosynthesis